MKTRIAMTAFYRISRSSAVVLFLCICVLSQMLGAPVILVTLLTEADTLTESALEDFSVLPSVSELERPSLLRIPVEVRSSLHFPLLVTSVFHPPLL